jgi:hypothetical protein
MKNVKMMTAAVVAATLFAPALNARASDSAQPTTDVQALAQTALQCLEQPYGLTRSGRKVMGTLRSRCAHVVISQDRAVIDLLGRSFTVLIKDSETSDGGDLNDLFVQYDSREDHEVQVAKNVLSFGDPALALVLASGRSADPIPQVLDPKLSQ